MVATRLPDKLYFPSMSSWLHLEQTLYPWLSSLVFQVGVVLRSQSELGVLGLRSIVQCTWSVSPCASCSCVRVCTNVCACGCICVFVYKCAFACMRRRRLKDDRTGAAATLLQLNLRSQSRVTKAVTALRHSEERSLCAEAKTATMFHACPGQPLQDSKF